MARRFGAYELVRKLGRGGMAETYEAVRRHGGVVQRVCVKCILPDFESDAEFVELFLREARISSTLRHANVVQVLDFGEQAGRHYLVLELVDGVDLRNLLRQLMSAGDRLPAGVLAHLAIELAQALDYAHAARPDGSVQGVVHRDISPSNVLLSPTGDVKLTDFGVAKVMDFTSCTRTGAVKGKIPYMAPEYARGGEYDARSDLFSLGVLLYECAAGRRPFDGASEVETLERVHSGRHVPLQDLASKDLSPALVQAIEALIARDPDDRPTTAGDLLQRLGDATPPPSARLRLGKTVAELERRAEGERERLGLDATMRATPEGTAVVASERPKAWIVDTAPPDAETRTRLPEPERPVPSVTDTPTRRHSLGASRGTSHATQGTRADPPQETPTPEPDPVVTPEPDPVVTPEPDPVVTPDPSAPLPWRSSSLALLALLLFIALGIGAGIWLLSAGAG